MQEFLCSENVVRLNPLEKLHRLMKEGGRSGMSPIWECCMYDSVVLVGGFCF